MLTVSERLKKVMLEQNITQGKLASIVEVSDQAVTNWIKRNQISVNAANKISSKFGYSIEWLLTGRTSNNSEIIPTNYEVTDYEGLKDKSDFVELPYYNVDLSAGNGFENGVEYEKMTLPFRLDSLTRKGLHKKDLCVVRVVGNSMIPFVKDGSIVGVNLLDKEIKDGEVYAVRIGELQRVKILIQNFDGSITMRSYNQEYKDEIITKEQLETREAEIIGRIWWSSSML